VIKLRIMRLKEELVKGIDHYGNVGGEGKI
jgi:hypothetical protein